MVAIVAGKGVGLERSSAWVLGSEGQLGSASQGRGGDNVFVNGANGNLVITRQDEFLIGRGPDVSIDRTYNSQTVAGVTDGDNNDQWRMGVYRRITGIPASYGSAYSTVKRIDWDGSDTVYTWDSAKNAYIGKEGAGAYDKLTRSGTTWTWTDGDSQITELYDQNQSGRLTFTTDQDGNSLTYTYNGSGQITRVTSTNGSEADEYTDLVYTGTLLTQITTSTGSGLTRVFYEYDAAGRLWKVNANLDPGDNSASIGANYVTTYSYFDSTSKRVTKIEQSDGSELTIGYTLQSGLYKVTSLTQKAAAGVTRTTSITYSTNKATVVDAAGNTIVFNTQYPGDLSKIEQGSSYRSYIYDGDGDLAFVDFGPTTSASYDYDGNGNRIQEVDRSGNTIKRTFSAKNELLTETRYATPDPDGVWGGGQPGSPMTTRYAYDGYGHLRYMVSAEGNVTEYVTQTNEASLGYGRRIATIDYAANSYDVSGLAANASIATGTLDSWAAAISDKSTARRTETSYDFRGNVTAVKSQEKLLASGQFDTGSALSHEIYVYDQAGNLLSRQDPVTSASELFVYDGFNRLIASTDFHNVTTNTIFYDSTATTVVNYANNLVATSLYNLAGELITYTESGPEVTSSATNYRYDALGRLRVTIDPLGQRDYFYYDQVGRQIGEIDSDGSATEYRYDGNGNLVSTTRYATTLSAGALDSLADGNGNPTSVTFASVRPATHADDRWTWNSYDMSQRLVRTVDATGAITGYTYDAASRLLSTMRYSTLLSSTTLANMKVQNLWANSGDGTLWQASGLSVEQSGTIGGANAYKFTTTASSGYEAVTGAPTAVVAGDTITFTIWVKGVGSTTTAEVGILGSFTGWGAEGDSTAYVVDASYSAWAEMIAPGRFRINGLPTNTAVPVIVTRTFNLAETATSMFYVQDSGQQVPAGRAAILASPMVTVEAGPAETSSDDRLARNFYDSDDRLIATLDGEGYLTEILYDKAGYKTKTIAYANATEPDDRAGGTLEVLRNGIAIDTAKDIHNYFVHDARGLLRATVDGEGDLTRYRYTPLGDVDQIVTGQKLDPAALLATPPTFANLPAAGSGTLLQTTAFTRNLFGQVLTETRSLTGTTSTTTEYVYDAMRQLVSATTQAGGVDPRILSQRYDARGRLKGELSGIGSALLAALGPNPDPEQADPIWAEYGTLYGYDAADRLITTASPNGSRILFYYDSDDRLAYQVNGLGEVVEYRYDGFGGRTDTIVYAARIDSETFSEMTGGRASDVAATIAALANGAVDSRLSNTYDSGGRLTMENDLLGSYSLYAYNSFSEVRRRNTAFGESAVTPGLATEIQTDFDYDRRGVLRSQIVDSADGGLAIWTTFGVDAFGREVVLTDAALNTTTKAYDRAGRVTSTTDALGNTTSFTYDARGNLVAVEDAGNNVTRYVYDLGGRRIFAVDARGGVVATSYDDDGRVLVTRGYAIEISLGSDLELEAAEITNALDPDPDDRITRYAYDKDGRLRFAVEAGQALTGYRYDDIGNAIRTEQYGWAVSPGSTFTFEDLQAQVEAHDALNDPKRVSRSVYDRAGRMTFAIDAAGAVTVFTYDSAGRIIKQVALATAYPESDDPDQDVMQGWAAGNLDADDRTSRAVYDRKGRLVYSIDAMGFVTEYRHTRTGEVTTHIRYADAYAIGDGATPASVAALLPGAIPASAAVTSFSYDSAGRLNGMEDTLGNQTVMILDQLGQITQSTLTAWDQSQTIITLRGYDELGRLQFETRAAGAAEEVTTAYGYNVLSQLVSITYAAGTADACVTTRAYDALGRLETETRATGAAEEVTTAFGYTAFGDVESVAVAAGTSDESVTTRTWDLRGRLESETRAAGTGVSATTQFDYDLLGQEIVATDPLSFVTTRTYDALDRLIGTRRQVDADPGNDLVTTIEYDAFGNAVKVTDARLNSSYFYYDALGRVELEIDQEGYATATTYQALVGEPETVTRYATKLSGPFDVAVRPTPATDADDATTSFDYDELGRLTGVTDAETHSESYALDLLGNRTRMTNKLGGITDYTYDQLGRMTTQSVAVDVHQSDGTLVATNVLTEFEYDRRGNLKVRTEGANLGEWVERATSYAYDKLDRLIEIDRPDISTVTVGIYMLDSQLTMKDSFAYDRRGNVIASQVAGAPRTYAYYDALGRKIDEVDEAGMLSHWAYDANGNVTSHKVYADAVAYPGTRPAAPPNPVNANSFRQTHFTYDRANRLETTYGAVLSTARWDGDSYDFASGAIVREIEYDAAGNAIRESVGDVETRSFFDKLGRKIAALDAENYLTVWERDAEGNVLKETRHAGRVTGSIDQDASIEDLHAAAGSSIDDRITEFTYDRNGRRETETRLELTASTTVAGVLATTNHVASQILYEYNGFGQVVRKLEANGDETLFTYDDFGQLTKTRAPGFTNHLGASVRPTADNFFDGFGNVVRATVNNENGAAADARVTTYSYDRMGWLTTMTQAITGTASTTHVYFHDAGGRVVADRYSRTKSSGSNVTEALQYSYDISGRLIKQTVAVKGAATPPAEPKWSLGDQTHFRYNVYGEMTGRGINTDANFNPAYQETFDYDEGGRLWRSTEGGSARIMFYDAMGNATLILSSAGANVGALTFVQAKDSIEATLGAGDTNIDNAVTTIGLFDKRGQQTATIEPDRQLGAGGANVTITNSRVYNAYGETSSETDGRNYTTDFFYNTMGRLVRKESPQVSWTDENGALANARPTEHYFYDVSGRLVAVTNANGFTTRRNLLAGTGHGGGEALVTVEYHADDTKAQTLYDVFGDARIQRNEYWIDGGTNDTSKTDTLLAYDKLGRLVEVQHLGRLLTETYTYDQLGQRTIHTMNSLAETTDYDRQGRVVSQVAFGGDITTYTYLWDGTLTNGVLGNLGGWLKTTIYSATLDATETLDYFGRVTARSDFGNNAYAFTFDWGGRVTSQATSGETLTYTYLNTGRISQISNGAGNSSSFGYDKAGNETSEVTYKSSQLVQNGTATWDALGRMSSWAEAGTSTLPAASILYEYDRVGNIRRQKASFQRLDGFGQPVGFLPSQDNWYRYDMMNRVTTDRGFLVAVVGSELKTGDDARGIGTIRRQLPGILTSLNRLGEVGYDYTYDATGRRMSMAMTKVRYEGGFPQNAYFREHKEMYDYYADGSLWKVRQTDGAETGAANFMTISVPAATGNGTLLSEFARDALGRVTSQTDWMTPGVRGYSRTGILYNDKGQITQETVSTLASEDGDPVLYVNLIENNYGTGDDYARGAVVSSTSTVQRDNSPHSTATTTNTYDWRDAPVITENQIYTEREFGATTDYRTTYFYAASTELVSVDIQDGRPRDVYFTNDMAGQVIRRDETGGNSSGAPHEIWYRFGGKQMGQISNNGTLDNDYQQSLLYRQVWLGDSEGLGPFRLGGTVPKHYADFSQSLDPINSYAQGGAGGGYVVRAGDTLQSIASIVWGNADLWYKLAEANGLSASSALVEGSSLTIPAGVVSNAHNDGTFRPYDAAKALGDLSPSAAKPPAKPGGCGMIGQFIMMAVAIAVSILLPPIAPGLGPVLSAALTAAVGSTITQGIGVITGIQQKFDWKSVGIAALTAGLTAGLGQIKGPIGAFATQPEIAGSAALGLAARAVVFNAASQGIAVATGLQKKFSWAGVAAAGVVAGVGGFASGQLQRWGVSGTANRAIANAVGGLSGAGARAAITGTSFGDNIIAVLPDVIVSTIGMGIQDMIAAEHGAANTAAKEQMFAKEEAAADLIAANEGSTGIPIPYAPLAGETPEQFRERQFAFILSNIPADQLAAAARAHQSLSMNFVTDSPGASYGYAENGPGIFLKNVLDALARGHLGDMLADRDEALALRHIVAPASDYASYNVAGNIAALEILRDVVNAGAVVDGTREGRAVGAFLRGIEARIPAEEPEAPIVVAGTRPRSFFGQLGHNIGEIFSPVADAMRFGHLRRQAMVNPDVMRDPAWQRDFHDVAGRHIPRVVNLVNSTREAGRDALLTLQAAWIPTSQANPEVRAAVSRTGDRLVSIVREPVRNVFWGYAQAFGGLVDGDGAMAADGVTRMTVGLLEIEGARGMGRALTPDLNDVRAVRAAEGGAAAALRVETRNGYTYGIDELGRPLVIEGDLSLNLSQGRNAAAQRRAGGADRLARDDGGHYIARMFNGPLDDFNHFAQDLNFNRGAYRSLERSLRRDLESGSQVRVRIEPAYNGSSLRPDSLTVHYWVDGTPDSVRFMNQRGGR